MEELMEAFRADVERTEAARLRFITMRTAEARTLLDMLEQTSPAQRTDEECNSAAAPAAGQAGLAIPAEITKALQTVANWDLPATGRTWEDGSTMSYGACWGSNGERDYMRKIASDALTLAAPVAADTEQATELNAELLKRLEWAVRFIETYAREAAMPATPEVNKCRAAIVKAKGGAA